MVKGTLAPTHTKTKPKICLLISCNGEKPINYKGNEKSVAPCLPLSVILAAYMYPYGNEGTRLNGGGGMERKVATP